MEKSQYLHNQITNIGKIWRGDASGTPDDVGS